jgi:hypothetical protein
MVDSCSRIDSTAKATPRILLKKSLSLSELLSHGPTLFQKSLVDLNLPMTIDTRQSSEIAAPPIQ